MSELKFEPDYMVHPKESLKECIEESMAAFSDKKDVALVNRVLAGGLYSSDEATTLGDNTPYSRDMWLSLQNNYLIKLVESQKQPWISINDENELPPVQGEKVLVKTKDFGTTVGWHRGSKDEWTVMTKDGWLVYDRVISWLSIPD